VTFFGTAIAPFGAPQGGRAVAREANIKRSQTLFAPALLLSVAAVAPLSQSFSTSLPVQVAPLVVFGGGVLLGTVLGRGRLVLGMMVLAVTAAAFLNFGGRTTFQAMALLLPVNLGIVAWLGETRVLSRRNALWLGVMLIQAAVVGVIHFIDPTGFGAGDPSLEVEAGFWTSLPRLAVVAFVVMLGLHVMRFVRGRHPLPAATAWALVASFLALDTVGSGGSASAHFATAGLLLAVGGVLEPRGLLHKDDVTGLPASLEFNQAVRELPLQYALAVVSIDEFRAFRQEQGAAVANRMLRVVAKALRKVGGGGRVFYLLRDHEFVVVFKRKTAIAALHYLDVIRREVQSTTLDVRVPLQPPKTGGGKSAPRVARTVGATVSVGIAEPQGFGADPHEVLRNAERALLRAQGAGMNRIVIYSPAEAVSSVPGRPIPAH
jgi:GGDEF domain-containing protein